MAMDYVWAPDMLSNFEGRAAELTVAFRVVGVIAAAAAVESIAIEVRRVVDEKIAHAADDGTVGDGWKAEARAAHGNRHTGNDDRAGFRSAVARQHYCDVMSETDQCFR